MFGVSTAKHLLYGVYRKPTRRDVVDEVRG